MSIVDVRSELRLHEASERARRLGLEANRAAAEALLERANRLVPRASGELEASGHIVDDGETTAAVTYDDPKTRYLMAHPEYAYADGRSGRWLSEALEDGTGELGELIVDTIRSGWPG